MTAEDLARLARGWDEAADGYEAYYVPRFAPWVAAATRALPSDLPDGPVLVPCCGTFPELDVLLEHLPGREIVGIDLSAGMAARARRRAADHPLVRVAEGDASELEPASAAAVVSVFGLQQLPAPDSALRSWARALRRGGVLSVVYWPHSTEPGGPFTVLSDVLRAHVPAGDRSWEERLSPALEGTVVERDEQVSFPMTHPDADTFFTAHTLSGPMRPLVDARGEEFIAMLREEFLRRAPEGEWRHRPHARHVVARALG
ncbi:class I SAM-dependent methyltransferase [Amycolatopsis regifaucium]|uniref:Methyltransferase type 11 n=1 Tax=Amycolatopsis regifaucium TaxID=546365 RepID=A0A154M4A9_9PSEU|nr:class I SAM-dependent methyltransferase [Amycolatopsis regifaucium]KZB79464.1 methyltransferase type 11 [Amycolatopsis regifaucium]OKA07646.1 methyltransferase type 11 [Amycolatopsis regifaucium]SFH06432.1 Methyltransferase domain-containing protein [Amycolatopsis regifaucium]